MLNNFFNPKSIAVIGASRHKNKIGHSILKNLLDAKFKGKLYPVNPKAEKILNQKCYASIKQLPKKLSLAIIVIPAQFVLTVLKECGEQEIKNVIIISAGFRESGSNGLKLEKELKELAMTMDINILGPNCLGLLDSLNNLNASFAKGMIAKGKISFISQSGAICSAMLDWAKKENIGFSKFVSLGNMAGINELDLLEYFITDKSTEAVFAYLENLSDGGKFVEIAKKLCLKKPLIVLKSGITERGKSMAMSHTGAMAEDDRIIEGILKQSNAIRCQSLSEIFDLAKLIANTKILKDNKLAVISNAGGINVITTDKISASSLSLAKMNDVTLNKLQKNLPPIVHVRNPLDIIGDADAERYSLVIESFCKDKNISNILVILTTQTSTEPLKTADTIVKFSKKYNKNIIASFIGGEEINEAVNLLKHNGMSNFSYAESAIVALDKLNVWNNNLAGIGNGKKVGFTVSKEKNEEIDKLISSKSGSLDYLVVKNILEVLDFPIIKSVLSGNLKDLSVFAQKLGYPVAMKAISNSIEHKTDFGAVKLGIRNPQELSKTYQQLIKINDKNKELDSALKRPSHKLPLKVSSAESLGGVQNTTSYGIKVLVQPMISGAIELIIGAKRDSKFGPIVLFGLGGIYTEIFKDISLRMAPIGDYDAERMMAELKISEIFEGARGMEIDKNAIVELLIKISYLITNHPNIKEIDLNPVMVKDGKIYIVDMRMIVE
ncbi:acetate--CoA ligase family protein [Patescibacteria group bacterium]